MLDVARHLGAESLRDGIAVAKHLAVGERGSQLGNGIRKRDQRSVRVHGDGVQLGGVHATHCQSAHCTTAMPSSSALQATIAVWSRGRPAVSAASARKSGKITRPNRGSDSSGQRELG